MDKLNTGDKLEYFCWEETCRFVKKELDESVLNMGHKESYKLVLLDFKPEEVCYPKKYYGLESVTQELMGCLYYIVGKGSKHKKIIVYHSFDKDIKGKPYLEADEDSVWVYGESDLLRKLQEQLISKMRTAKVMQGHSDEV